MPVELSTIERHTLAIELFTKKPSDAVLQTLSNINFWGELLEKSQHNITVQELHYYWKKIEPLAHLNTEKLLQLLEEHVLPLERAYEYLKADSGGTETQAQIRENRLMLTQLKAQIFESLLLRAKAHQNLAVSRQFDDVLVVILRAINGLRLIDKLPIQNNISYTLNDDRRLTIYDYLEQAGYEREHLIQNVTAPIPKRAHGLKRNNTQLNQKLTQLHIFRQELRRHIHRTLSTSIWLESLYTKVQKSLDPLKSQLGFWFLFIQKGRYVLYMGLSMLAYYFALQLMSPFILLTFGVKTLGTISNILFYTIGFAPVWAWGWQAGTKLLGKAYDHLTKRKTQQIFDALVLLEDFSHFIHEKLESKIIDISHFDIANLEGRYIKLLNELKLACVSLQDYSLIESLLCHKGIKDGANSLLGEFATAESDAQKAIFTLCNQLAEDISDEIEVIEYSLSQKRISTSISKDQISSLHNFVLNFSNKVTADLFAKNANPINRWIDKFDSGYFQIPSQRTNLSLQIPWGGFTRRADLLNGWKHIIQAFELEPDKREACVTLMGVLAGDLRIKNDAFLNCIKKLHLGPNESNFVKSLQRCMFATLDSSTAYNARLLSDEQKFEIAKWRTNHKDNIERASEAFAALINDGLSPHSNEELSCWFELLDAEDVFLYSLEANNILSQRQNLVRAAIESYQGNSDMFRFIRFVPVHERAELITHIADKRLKWLLDHDPGAKFSKCDIELFNHPDLIKSKFNFSKTISRSKSVFVPQFIQKCREHLLGTQELVKTPRGVKPLCLS